jgi:predicted XRE-type DNA-binding protein
LDLGFEPAEAAKLPEHSNRQFSMKRAIRERLMSKISVWIEENNLKLTDPTEILGVTSYRISDVRDRNSIKFTIDALVKMMIRVGKQVTFSVR